MAESGGAEYLISIFGTEKDRVNCPFYFKIGACRHGDKCTRRHNRPTLSQTILFVNLWDNPVLKKPYNPKLAEEDFEDFCEDIFLELMKYGEIEDLYICDNISEHMVGNVYCKYRSEDDAAKAMVGLTGRFYNGKAVVAEYSPVTDFRKQVVDNMNTTNAQEEVFATSFMRKTFRRSFEEVYFANNDIMEEN